MEVELVDKKEEGPVKTLASIDLPVVKAKKEPNQYSDAMEQVDKFSKLKDLMVKLLSARFAQMSANEDELRETYRKQWVIWKRKIRQRRQDEASERIIAAVHSGRRFPMRASRQLQEEKGTVTKQSLFLLLLLLLLFSCERSTIPDSYFLIHSGFF